MVHAKEVLAQPKVGGNGGRQRLVIPALGEEEPRKDDLIAIRPIEVKRYGIEIIQNQKCGVICHEWSEKNRKQLRDQGHKKTDGPKPPRNPWGDFIGCFYLLPGATYPKRKVEFWSPSSKTPPTHKNMWSWIEAKDRFGLPAQAFQNAIVSEARLLEIPATKINAAVTVLGDEKGLIPIRFDRILFREDIVRIGNWPNKKPDLRYRPEFKGWSMMVPVQIDVEFTDINQVCNLFERAGFHVGIMDWRKEKKGPFGSFGLKKTKMRSLPSE